MKDLAIGEEHRSKRTFRTQPPFVEAMIVPEVQIDSDRWVKASFTEFAWNGGKQCFGTVIFWANTSPKTTVTVTNSRFTLCGIIICQGSGSEQDGYPCVLNPSDRAFLQLNLNVA